jgi:enamine deaminase RidA (YjgF/YER057c/UK114 family)
MIKRRSYHGSSDEIPFYKQVNCEQLQSFKNVGQPTLARQGGDPARTTCVVAALPDPKMLIEIEGVASLAGR